MSKMTSDIPYTKYAWSEDEVTSKTATGVYVSRIADYAWEDKTDCIRILIEKPAQFARFDHLKWGEYFIALQIHTHNGEELSFVLQDLSDTITSASIEEKSTYLQITLSKAHPAPWKTILKQRNHQRSASDTESNDSWVPSDIDMENASTQTDDNNESSSIETTDEYACDEAQSPRKNNSPIEKS